MWSLLGQLVLAGLPLSVSAQESWADAVFVNGSIYTLDSNSSKVTALAVKGGYITYTGNGTEINNFIGPNTTTIDLHGRMAMPGLVDSHVHILSGGGYLIKCNLNYKPLAIEGILQHIQACIDSEPQKETNSSWLEVVNMNYPALLSKSGVRTKADFDKLKTTRPILVRGNDYHSFLVNSIALNASNITATTPNPPNGKIERLPGSNEPSGMLQDDAWRMLSGPPPDSPADQIDAARAALKIFREAGITTFQDAAAGVAHGTTFAAVAREGGMTARGYFDYRIDEPADEEALARTVQEAVRVIARFTNAFPIAPRPGQSWQAVKIFLDGVVFYPSMTGAVLEPYRIPSENGTWIPDPKGPVMTYWKPDMLSRTLEELLLEFVDVQLHCDGDRAVRVALDAVEAFRKKHPDRKDYRVGLAHNELSDPKDWPRFKELEADAIMSFQWAAPRGGNGSSDTGRSFGPERMNHLQSFGEIAQFGRPVIYGSDWPVSLY
jgi:predicted amidohydrolase YtcJ